MSMTLYHGEPSGPSLTALATLFEKGLDAELKYIDLTAGARHDLACRDNAEVAMSIEGEGPVLVVDGTAMTDSFFLALYLDEVGSGAPLQPADAYENWKLLMWCRHITERVAPAAAFLGTQACLTPKLKGTDIDALTAKIKSADLAERWRDTAAGTFPEDKAEDSRAKIKQAVDKVEAALDGKDWVLGAFSIADLETYAWLAGMTDICPDAFAGAVRTNAWLARVAARPSVKKALSLSKTGAPTKAWSVGPEINRWG